MKITKLKKVNIFKNNFTDKLSLLMHDATLFQLLGHRAPCKVLFKSFCNNLLVHEKFPYTATNVGTQIQMCGGGGGGS